MRAAVETPLTRVEHGLHGVRRRIDRRRDLVGELAREMGALEPWYQPVDLGHGLVAPARDKNGRLYSPRLSLDRGLGKWRRFVEPNLPVPLEGARVVEVGCNAGLHLVECLRRGAREAIGLEVDEHYHRQARFVANALGRLRGGYVPLRVYRGAMESFEWQLTGRFDLALLLNVIYHVGRVRGERLLTPEETFEQQVAAVRGVAEVAQHLVFAANPLADEGFGKGSESLRAIVDAAELEVVHTASARHPRGYVLVARSRTYREETPEVPVELMVNKYFLPAAQSAEREFADRVAAGGEADAESSRYFRLRTAADDWRAPGQASLPEGLEREPDYWVVPWACKPRRPDPAERDARRRAFPDLERRFRDLRDSLASRGFDPALGRVRAFRLIHPEHGEVYQYIDGNQRVGVMAHLAAQRGESLRVPGGGGAGRPARACGRPPAGPPADRGRPDSRGGRAALVRPGVRGGGAVSSLAERAVSGVRVRLARRRMGSQYRFEDVPGCLCGASGGNVALAREDAGKRLGLVLCPSCGLGRLSPRLAPDELPRYYEGDYRTLVRGSSRIDRAYFERGVRRGRRLVEHLRERSALPAPGTGVLEVGAGAGGILAAFRERGHPVAGSDLDPECVAFAQGEGLDVRSGETVDAPELAPAGLIVLSHLVEHLPDPLATLRALEPYADAGTVLYVEVPGLRATRPGDAVPQIPHLYYYDLTTLSWLLARVGWELADGDEEVRAIFRRRPGHEAEVSTDGNAERNAAYLRELG